jgi:hypothetical protein
MTPRCLLGVGEELRHCGTAALGGAALGAALPLLVRVRVRIRIRVRVS